LRGANDNRSVHHVRSTPALRKQRPDTFGDIFVENLYIADV